MQSRVVRTQIRDQDQLVLVAFSRHLPSSNRQPKRTKHASDLSAAIRTRREVISAHFCLSSPSFCTRHPEALLFNDYYHVHTHPPQPRSSRGNSRAIFTYPPNFLKGSCAAAHKVKINSKQASSEPKSSEAAVIRIEAIAVVVLI